MPLAWARAGNPKVFLINIAGHCFVGSVFASRLSICNRPLQQHRWEAILGPKLDTILQGATRRDKSSYTDTPKWRAEHIADSYEDRGVSKKSAKSRAWATMNKEVGVSKKSDSGRGKKESHSSSRKV